MKFNEVIIKGGVGNQLFALFYAYKLLIKYNKVSLNLISYKFLRRSDRQFILSNLYPRLSKIFNINNSIISYFLYFYSIFLEKFIICSDSNMLLGDESISAYYWPNKIFHFGYFQKINDSKLDQEAIKLLQNDLAPFVKKVKYKYLAIHIRRGDYLEKKHSIHGLIKEKDLLIEAKRQLSKTDYEGITIFSDSPELVDVSIFKTLHKNVFIDKGGNPVEVFKRMCNHKGLVASNSTFSLWAGILGKIEYFSIPKYWMKKVKSSLLGLESIPRYECRIY